MDKKATIKHEGIVENIGTDRCSVRILQASACSSCSARSLCHSSESKEKVVEVSGHYPTLQVGDKVTLVGSVREGNRASVCRSACLDAYCALRRHSHGRRRHRGYDCTPRPCPLLWRALSVSRQVGQELHLQDRK